MGLLDAFLTNGVVDKVVAATHTAAQEREVAAKAALLDLVKLAASKTHDVEREALINERLTSLLVICGHGTMIRAMGKHLGVDALRYLADRWDTRAIKTPESVGAAK